MTKANEVEETEGTEENLECDFNLENDFRPDPLLPNGTYSANVVDMQHKTDKSPCFSWKVTLDGNGGYMNDGETSVDGVQLYFNNWLPKKGDEAILTPSGKSTKFQSKVNMLKQFADDMKLNLNSLGIVKEAIANGEYIGLPVRITVSTQEYPENSGKFKNQIDRMVAA